MNGTDGQNPNRGSFKLEISQNMEDLDFQQLVLDDECIVSSGRDTDEIIDVFKKNPKIEGSISERLLSDNTLSFEDVHSAYSNIFDVLYYKEDLFDDSDNKEVWEALYRILQNGLGHKDEKIRQLIKSLERKIDYKYYSRFI
jgi:hypothetical protein